MEPARQMEMHRTRSHPAMVPRWLLTLVIIGVMSLMVACAVPSGQAPGPSPWTDAGTLSIEPSPLIPTDPSSDPTASPTLDLTPEPAPLTPPPVFTWQRHVLPGLAYGNVLSHGDQFLATGPAGGDEQDQFSVLGSDDGRTWRTLARRPFDGQYPVSMTSVDGRLIVSARRRLAPESFEDVVWQSEDGKSWRIWMDPHGAFHPKSFARIGDRWLMAMDYGNGIQSSPNGTDWTTGLPLHGAAEGAGLAVGPNGILAPVTQEGQDGPGRSWMYMSVDGLEWTEATFEDAVDTKLWRAAANDNGYVVLGLGSYQTFPSVSRAWWSADGGTWQRAVVPDDFGKAVFYPTAIASYRGGFLATVHPQEEGPSRMLWSEDGRAWQWIDGGPGALYEGTGLVVDGDRVLWFGFELTDPEVRTLWEATPAD